jgi:hypothetical protein
MIKSNININAPIEEPIITYNILLSFFGDGNGAVGLSQVAVASEQLLPPLHEIEGGAPG